MPHDMTDEDWKKRLLVLILIEDRGHEYHRPTSGDFDQALPRYLRELARRGVGRQDFYSDVWGRYPEVHDAVVYGMSEDAYHLTMHGWICRIKSLCRLIDSHIYLTADEVRLAREAAQIAVRKYWQHAPDDDLVENKTLAQE